MHVIMFVNHICVHFSMHLYPRVVDDLEFLSFLKSKVIFCASVIVVQRYEQSDSTTCVCVHTTRDRGVISFQL